MSLPALLRLSATFLCLLLAAGGAQANDMMVWTAVTASGPISGNLIGYFDMTVRFTEDVHEVGTFQLRGGAGWRFRSGLILGGGYSYIRSDRSDRPPTHEHRIFQQATYPITRWGGTTLAGRTRLEERFRVGADDMGLRLRQQLRLTVPFDDPNGPRAIAHSELLLLLKDTDWGQRKGPDQLRTFVGIGIPIGSRVVLETGYLNQQVFLGPNRENHALSLTLATSF
jgi:hypothetical protein